MDPHEQHDGEIAVVICRRCSLSRMLSVEICACGNARGWYHTETGYLLWNNAMGLKWEDVTPRSYILPRQDLSLTRIFLLHCSMKCGLYITNTIGAAIWVFVFGCLNYSTDDESLYSGGVRIEDSLVRVWNKLEPVRSIIGKSLMDYGTTERSPWVNSIYIGLLAWLWITQSIGSTDWQEIRLFFPWRIRW